MATVVAKPDTIVAMDESVDLPGTCPRIGILFKIEKFLKISTVICLILRALIF